jgi:acetyl-CoA carboxylase carboxyl transferase subunit beta
MIGFAGARVTKQTTNQDLPKGFQTSEFLLERGLIDRIVPRPQLRGEIARILDYLGPRGTGSKPGRRGGRAAAQGASQAATNGHPPVASES